MLVQDLKQAYGLVPIALFQSSIRGFSNFPQTSTDLCASPVRDRPVFLGLLKSEVVPAKEPCCVGSNESGRVCHPGGNIGLCLCWLR